MFKLLFCFVAAIGFSQTQSSQQDCPKFCTPNGQYAEQILSDLDIHRPMINTRTGETKQKSDQYLAEKYNKYCSPEHKFIPGNIIGCRTYCGKDSNRLKRIFKKDMSKYIDAHLSNLTASCKTLRQHLLAQGYQEDLNFNLSFNPSENTPKQRPLQRKFAGAHRVQEQSQEHSLQTSRRINCATIEKLENDLKNERKKLNLRLSGVGNSDEIDGIMSTISDLRQQLDMLREQCNF